MSKSILLLFAGTLCTLSLLSQENHSITVSGFSFNPQVLKVNVGDKITFNTGNSHPILQVSETTYNGNGNTALPGGFSFSSGSGIITAGEPGSYYYVCANHFSSGMKGKIEISEVTSASASISFDGVTLYPNPVLDEIRIDNIPVNQTISFTVLDISGKELIKMSEPEKNLISVKHLKKGLYILKIKLDDSVITRKFLKY